MKFTLLSKKLTNNLSDAELSLLEKAYKFADKAHEGQMRASGEPFIEHSIAVADILVDLGLPPVVLVSALLHDVVEDSTVSLKSVERTFGDEVALMVDGVTKLTGQVQRQHSGDKLQSLGSEYRDTKYISDDQAETIRKTFLAMSDDVRIVIIKLADRLHNMRTLNSLSINRRQRIAQETLDIFAPLANRLGMWQIKWELEDLGFRYVNPKKYKEIALAINRQRVEREKRITATVARLQKELEQHGISAEVTGRPKHIYSIWNKMQRNNIPFDQIHDVRAVRVLVKDRSESVVDNMLSTEKQEQQAIADCYQVLGIVHHLWNPIPGEFDDYVATPKDNFYQSLHTTVVNDEGNPLEVQIRTELMHEGAEYGIASHWRYKEDGKKKQDKSFDKRINWLRSMMDWRQDLTDGHEFVDALKSDLFPDRVLAFTPRGDIVDLPNGATPIDFAYHIHTSVGERCRGAKVNGVLVALNHLLESGDQVEVLTSKAGGPNRDWLNTDLGYVKSARAREKIRSWFRRRARKENIAMGRSIVDRELKRLNIKGYSIEKTTEIFGYKIPEDFFAAVGYGDIHGQTVINHIVEWLRSKSEQEAESLPPPQEVRNELQIETPEISVSGTRGLVTLLARCCHPVPGDEIVGYTTRVRGVTIHRKDCSNILRVRERDRLISVEWRTKPDKVYPVTVRIEAFDREGLMRDISTIVADEHVNMGDVSTLSKGHEVHVNVTLEVSDLSQLSRVLSKIEELTNVTMVQRYRLG
jgi:GTP pyrophosphokinase